MAGYFLYSISNEKLQAFLDAPTDDDLLALAEIVSEGIDEIDGELDDDDPVADWPAEPEELKTVLREHLSQDDWYSLSEIANGMLESALHAFFEDESRFGFRCESDGVYWDLIELIRMHHGISSPEVKHPMARFGVLPLRCHAVGKGCYGFHPMHSMHPPEEVRQMLAATKEAESAVMASSDENAKRELEEELLPTLERLSEQLRVLFVGVDT